MASANHPDGPEIKVILSDLNTQWKDLYDKSTDKGNKLRQAADQQTLNRALADAQVYTRVISLVILISLVAIIFVLQFMTSDFPFGIFKLSYFKISCLLHTIFSGLSLCGL